MDRKSVVVEKVLIAPVEKVWKALTDPDDMGKWYFPIQKFEPVAGFCFDFSVENNGETFKHICCVKEVIHLQKLAYSWRYDGFSGDTLVSFTLELRAGNSTYIKLEHTGLETFPAEQPAFSAENFQTGWNMIIGKMLKEFVEQP